MKRLPLVMLLVALVGLGFAHLNPGVVYEIETTDLTDTPINSTMMVEEGVGIKMTILPGQREESGDMIFRSDRREMIVVDHQEQAYFVIDEAFVKQMSERLAAVKTQLDAVMKNLPEEQRRMIEEAQKRGGMPGMPGMAGADEGPKTEYRKTSERATKAGYPCVRYDVFRDGEKVKELWVTDWDNVDGSDEAQAVFGDMADFYGDLLDAFSEEIGPIGGGNDPFASFTEIDGFPIVTRDFDGGELESESTLRSATRRTLDPADFEPPAGYKRRMMGS